MWYIFEFSSPPSRLIFVNRFFNKILLLCVLLFSSKRDESKQHFCIKPKIGEAKRQVGNQHFGIESLTRLVGGPFSWRMEERGEYHTLFISIFSLFRENHL